MVPYRNFCCRVEKYFEEINLASSRGQVILSSSSLILLIHSGSGDTKVNYQPQGR